MFGKNNFSGFLGKGFNEKLVGAGKSLSRAVDNPVVHHAGVSSLAPEESTAKKYGMLERFKH